MSKEEEEGQLVMLVAQPDEAERCHEGCQYKELRAGDVSLGGQRKAANIRKYMFTKS